MQAVRMIGVSSRDSETGGETFADGNAIIGKFLMMITDILHSAKR